jgi:hypothetical protein
MRTGPGISDARHGEIRRSSLRAPSTQIAVRPDHTSWMVTSLLLWLCTLPVIGVLILPWLGARVALIVAATLLLASVTACYAICTWRVAEPKRGARDE